MNHIHRLMEIGESVFETSTVCPVCDCGQLGWVDFWRPVSMGEYTQDSELVCSNNCNLQRAKVYNDFSPVAWRDENRACPMCDIHPIGFSQSCPDCGHVGQADNYRMGSGELIGFPF